MTGRDLYEQFKDALNFLGDGFHGMDNVKIFLTDYGIAVENEDKICVIKIPTKNKLMKELRL